MTDQIDPDVDPTDQPGTGDPEPVLLDLTRDLIRTPQEPQSAP